MKRIRLFFLFVFLTVSVFSAIAQTPEQITDQSPEQAAELIPEPAGEHITGQIPEPTDEQTAVQIPEQEPAQTSEQSQITGQIPEQPPDQLPDQTAEQIPEQEPGQLPDQTAEQIPEQEPEQLPDKDPAQKTKISSFFIAPLLEFIGYSVKGVSMGGGFAIGGGDGISIGLRFMYSFTLGEDSINALELAVFMRYYLCGNKERTGLFIQLNAGVTAFAYEEAVSFPVEVGALSLGLALGWRFQLGNRWYLEPSVRIGYPYIAGVGVSAAFHPL